MKTICKSLMWLLLLGGIMFVLVAVGQEKALFLIVAPELGLAAAIFGVAAAFLDRLDWIVYFLHGTLESKIELPASFRPDEFDSAKMRPVMPVNPTRRETIPPAPDAEDWPA